MEIISKHYYNSKWELKLMPTLQIMDNVILYRQFKTIP